MALSKNVCFLFLCLVLVFSLADSRCPKTFKCGDLGPLEFPLTDAKDPRCGVLLIDGCDSDDQIIQLEPQGRWYDILNEVSQNSFFVRDPLIQRLVDNRTCHTFINVSLPVSPLTSFRASPNITFYSCWNGPNDQELPNRHEPYLSKIKCSPFTLFYQNTTNSVSAPSEFQMPPQCSLVQVPMDLNYRDHDSPVPFNFVASEFNLEWYVSEACTSCHRGGGQCLTDSKNQFVCKKGAEDGIKKWKLALAISGAGMSLLLLCLFVSYVVWQRKKRNNGDYLMSGKISSSLSSRSDSKGGSFYYNIPVFSYTELEEATNNFDPYKELGDGGFGTVYYGKLQDGREVAIKRLYEHNFRRVEQFLNEIKILTALRHPNLVSLYGCTSRRSRKLLLVYEYISNGTVADHIHGVRAKEALLTWPIRMRIAIETATALAYLHRSDIIHRDVKTYNILLDSKFSVKVADFGLSRLFPDNVTHISTAPQGTPGYVDPDYHQSYQLTDKSDVYSFGVVLIELISSMPAVDITRHRHEINLSNLAVDRIQRHAYDELIDSSLGYGSDPKVTMMTTSVAELAFSCLQLDKDSRPSMDEVVDFLKDIEGGEVCNFEKIKGVIGNQTFPGKIPPSPEVDDVFLLKNKNFQTSPTSVIGRWASSSTTTSSIE